MKFFSRLLLLCIFGCGTVFAQSTSAVVNTSSCEKPEYPSASKRLEEEGTVQLKFLVGTDGRVIDSAIEKSSGFRRLDEAAKAALSKCQFKPATVGGVTQQSWASMKFTWRLEIANQCPVRMRLSGGYGCLSDYVFVNDKDIETSRKVLDIASQSIGYVIAVAKEKSCNSISINSITSSLSGDDTVEKTISACKKQGCDCAVLINNGLVADPNLFAKYSAKAVLQVAAPSVQTNSTLNNSNQTILANGQNINSNNSSKPEVNQSNLPACLGRDTARWNNCFGTETNSIGHKYVGEWKDGKQNGQGIFTFNVGSRYVGEFKDGKRNGQGTLFASNGSIIDQGIWADNNFVRTSPLQQAITSSAPTNSAERDRLNAEVEAERKKRQELEEQLRVAQQSTQPNKPEVTTGIERRIALVIGNATYKVNPLKNPVNDSTDMARSLRSVGFDVIEANNTTLAQMREVTRRFADKLGNSDVGLVYYSGHGVEVKGKNYLIPVNADIKREYEVVDQAFDASQFLEMMDNIRGPNNKRVNILIVDACRNNELQKSWRSNNNGLARMDAPGGTFISFATAPGRVAADGTGRNSPYTKHLLQALKQPNVPIEQVFKVVRRNVMEETKGEQIPWENSSLVGDFYFTVQR